MNNFKKEYAKLNTEQKRAVDTIEGPLMVIAGPGTGKTQMLSLRVANILRQPATNPNEILCLTFTDNAARNMRERLEGIIGQSAYHVAIHTFHSFGVEVINQYPDFFTQRALLQNIDELGQYQLVKELFENLPHNNPLSAKVGGEFIFLKDTLDVISWLKHHALRPNELRHILKTNENFMELAWSDVQTAFATTPSAKQLPVYRALVKKLTRYADNTTAFGFSSLAKHFISELNQAINEIPDNKRYAPSLTAFRKKWLEKDSHGKWQFKDNRRSLKKMRAIASIYEELEHVMTQRGLYDFDDMIMQVVYALENETELKFNLQERYQYIMVDEFQDTNKAQLRILEALGDNSVNAGRPNIMVVGDDDQAIYAFQGAEASNMLAFQKKYLKPNDIITLTQNYRSSQRILEASRSVIVQAEDRLEKLLPNVKKNLLPNQRYETDTVKHVIFASELQQYDWIAEEIANYIGAGYAPSEIAVLAPRHRPLERLVQYLLSRKLPVSYERREDILDAPFISQLLKLSELVQAIADEQHDKVNSLIGEVLSYPFWGLSLEELTKISLKCYRQGIYWLDALLTHKQRRFSTIAKWLIESAQQCHTEPLEYMIDRLLGSQSAMPINTNDKEIARRPNVKGTRFISPMRKFYFGSDRFDQATDDYLALLGQLSTLRERLRFWQPDRTLYLRDLVDFVDLHRQAKLKIIDTNPHTQATNAVQVMTVYKAKGLEFEIVFVINAQDDVWGPSAKSKADRIRLPANLTIKPAGDNVSDKLRLFYVALTRAKHTLYISSYEQDLNGKKSLPLRFIVDGSADKNESPHTSFKPVAMKRAGIAKATEILLTDWSARYKQIIANKPVLMEPILKTYKLSVTHLNNFIDIANGGPQYFMVHNLLRFPEAMTPNAAYGDAIHKTLQWLYSQLRRTSTLPALHIIEAEFIDRLRRKHLPQHEFQNFVARGKEALELFIVERGHLLKPLDIIEYNFSNEGVIVNGARLAGKIDKISRKGTGNLIVSDFKTGRPAKSWIGNDEYEKIKLHKYKQQLLFYKLLIEGSASFSKKAKAIYGTLEFIEADENGKLVDPLRLEYKTNELNRFKQLIASIWQHIMNLDFPEPSKYKPTLKGIIQFENDLIDGRV